MTSWKAATTAAVAVIIASPSVGSAGAYEDNLLLAATLEWTIANCGIKTIDPMLLMFGTALVNGLDPDDLKKESAIIRERVKARWPNREAACSDIVKGINPPKD